MEAQQGACCQIQVRVLPDDVSRAQETQLEVDRLTLLSYVLPPLAFMNASCR